MHVWWFIPISLHLIVMPRCDEILLSVIHDDMRVQWFTWPHNVPFYKNVNQIQWQWMNVKQQVWRMEITPKDVHERWNNQTKNSTKFSNANFNHPVSTGNNIAIQQTFFNIINMEGNVNIVTHVVTFTCWQTLADTTYDQHLSDGNCWITLKWQCSHSQSAYTTL